MRSTPEFFNVQPVGAALEALFAAYHVDPRSVTLDTADALGRILAEYAAPGGHTLDAAVQRRLGAPM